VPSPPDVQADLRAAVDALPEEDKQRLAAAFREDAERRRQEQAQHEEREREARKARGRRDPAWFLRWYLPKAFRLKFGRFQLDLIDDFKELIEASLAKEERVGPALRLVEEDWREVDTEPDDGEDYTEEELEALLEQAAGEVPHCEVAVCPRLHGKTSLLEGRVLWCVAYGLRNFILFCSSIQEQSMDRLSVVMGHIESNDRLHADFPELRPGKIKWTNKDGVTSTGIRLKAYGILNRIRGVKHGELRPDLALGDDIEDTVNVETELQRRKGRTWLTRVLMPALDNLRGVLFIAGTILHYDALLARLVDEDEHFPGWRKRRYKALNKDANGKLWALWPSRWPVPALLAQRSAKTGVGAIAFACEYQNDPISDETTLFQMTWLRGGRDRGRAFAESFEAAMATLGGVPPLVMVPGCDFGWVHDKKSAEERDSNYTVCITVAVHPETRHRHILRIYRDRGRTSQQYIDAIADEVRVTYPDPVECPRHRLAVETVGLQRQLYELGFQEQTDLSVVGINTGTEKADPYEGIPILSALFEGGQYHTPWPVGDDPESVRQRELVQTLENELWGLGSEAHDDMVLALWFTEVVIRRMLRVYDAALRQAAQREEQPSGRPQQPPTPAPAREPQGPTGQRVIPTRPIGVRRVG